MKYFLTLLGLFSLFACAQDAGNSVAPIQTDPCEALLASPTNQCVWPGQVVEALSGDTLLVQLKGVGLHRVKLAGLKAPQEKEFLAAVSKYHLSRMAKGVRIFVILQHPEKIWPVEFTAPVEDFTEAQLMAGMGSLAEAETELLSPYITCRCRRAQEQARSSGRGIWSTLHGST